MKRGLSTVALCALIAACGTLQPAGNPAALPRRNTAGPRLFDASSVYRAMGALVGSGELPFVASVRYLAGPTADSTLALFSVSLTNQTLTFQRHGSEFVAQYHVEATFRADSTSLAAVRQIDSDEEVRVRTFQETLRTDESVIFQRFVKVPPGVYYVTAMVRDQNGPAFARAARVDTVPRFSDVGMSKPITVYTADGRRRRIDFPTLVANPRATLPYGPDSMRFYVERYGNAPATRMVARVVDAANHELWRDSVAISTGVDVSSATIVIVPSKLPVGQAELQTLAAGGSDTTRTRFLVSFSSQWVITNFDEMMSLLRYFDRQDWVDSLRRAPPDRRPEVWREFWKATDPVPLTPENEAIDDYFRRVQQANIRFPEEGEQGWLTERGEVFITLGEPDDVVDMSNGIDRSTVRMLRWTYASQRLVLYFEDQTGFSRYRLTPASRADYQRALARVRQADR
ncbi:MAG TPA: GWxTD domain-containing protein [Gemmatimonadales bacterium]|nr:GWxTD domain-containing protein [Gemmatimonadales bacterium]